MKTFITIWTIFLLLILGLFSAEFIQAHDYAFALLFGGCFWFIGIQMFKLSKI